MLNDHDALSRELQTSSSPESKPERRIAEGRLELERLKIQLNQQFQDLLTPAFKVPLREVSDGLRGEMKDAIEAAKAEVKEWQTKLDSLRSEVPRSSAGKSPLQVERDKLFQELAALRVQANEKAKPAKSGRSSEEQQIEKERSINLQLRVRVEGLRLRILERKLALASTTAEARDVELQVLAAHVKLATRGLDLMQSRYKQLAESQERKLKQEAASEEVKARRAEDPLERYLSQRTSELLKIEAEVVKYEQSVTTTASPSLDEQRSHADHAASDFAKIQELLKDGNVSRLDALRLNNDFRRIGPERERLMRNERAAAEAQLQYYENNLTTVELSLIEDSLLDQVEHDAVLERLPPERQVHAHHEFDVLEQKHRKLLERQRSALEALVARSSQTLEQINRRLTVLEDEYGFIRTNIFWVRDQEPLGFPAAKQSGRELGRLLNGLFRLAEETGRSTGWSEAKPEFLAALGAAVVLPLGLIRLRRLLRRRMGRALPPVHLHGQGGQTAAVKVDMIPVIKAPGKSDMASG